jgi:KRAB domain-containing zinc finger protein
MKADDMQSMKDHLATHFSDPSQWKPFGCEWPGCHRGFDSKANLARHQLVHTKERPFPCPACSKRFNQKSNLHTHFKRMHLKGSAASASGLIAAMNDPPELSHPPLHE